MGNILIGTSSWTGHESFYPRGLPAGERLAYYARHFPIVEVNSTYYALPTLFTVERWVAHTPATFRFDVKPPRAFTAPEGDGIPHPDSATIRGLRAVIQPIAEAGKLGAVTVQFPPSFARTRAAEEYIRRIPVLLPRLPVAVEFRRRDWLEPRAEDATLALLRGAGLTYTMADEPQVGAGSVPPVYGITTPGLAIIRFHGRNEAGWYDFDGGPDVRFDWEYTDAELGEWLPRIRRASAEAAQLHIAINTSGPGQSVRNARRLMRLLGMPAPEEEPVVNLPLDF